MKFKLFLIDLNSKNQTWLRTIIIMIMYNIILRVILACVLINGELQRVVTCIYEYTII